MTKPITALIAGALMLMLACYSAVAKDKKAIDYIDAAKPYLHLSCQALVDDFGKDEKKMAEIVELMVAVSVINREIDLTKLLNTESDKTEFGQFLEKALKEQCKDDVQSLLMGNVDRAIVYAFVDRPEKK